MARNWFSSGEWNVWCMVCNRKIKSGESLKRWDGLIVCKDDYENRHPLDFLRARQERITVPFSAPTSFDQFVEQEFPPYPFCSAQGSSGIPSMAIAGCMRPNLGFPNGLPNTSPEIPDEPTNLVITLMDGSELALMTGGSLVTVSL